MVFHACHAEFCSNNINNQWVEGRKSFSYFKCPDDQRIRQQWLLAMDRPEHWKPPKHLYLCSSHFLPEDMRGPNAKGRLTMKKGAIPKLFPDPPIIPAVSTMASLRKCMVKYCPNDERNNPIGIAFHSPPNDMVLQWKKAIGPEFKKGVNWSSTSRKFVCSAHFEPGLVCLDRHYKLRKGAIPSIGLQPPDDYLLPTMKQQFTQVVRLPIKIENAMVDPSQAAKDALSGTSPDVVPIENVETTSVVHLSANPIKTHPAAKPPENEDTSSIHQLSAKPANNRTYGVVKIVCEICDALFSSSAKYRKHRIDHDTQAINPSSAVGSSECKERSVPQRTTSPSLDEIVDEFIKNQCIETNVVTKNSDEAPSGSDMVDESSQDVIYLDPVEKQQPPAAAAASLSAAAVPVSAAATPVSAAAAPISAAAATPSSDSSQDVICLGPIEKQTAAAVKTPAASASKSSQDVICYPPKKQLAVVSTLKDVSIRTKPKPTSFFCRNPDANFRCEICQKEFLDKVSFDTHKRVHELQAQIKAPATSKRLGGKPQLRAPLVKAPTSVNYQMIPEISLKPENSPKPEKSLYVTSQAAELVKAKNIIKVLYQKMRTLLQKNEHLQAIMKKNRIDFSSWKENKFLSGIQLTQGLKELDDIILNDTDGSFLAKLDVSQIEKVGNPPTLVIEQDGTWSERIIGGPPAGSQAPRQDKMLGGLLEGTSSRSKSTQIQVDQIEAGDTQITVNDSNFKVESSTDMDTDALFEIETSDIIDIPSKKTEKEPEVTDGGGLQKVETDPLEGVGNSVEDVTDSASTNAQNVPKHACGLCGHRTTTQEEMLEHITTHIVLENSEEVVVGVPDQEHVVLTGDSTTQAEAYSTANVDSTNLETSMHTSHVESQDCNEECSEKCAPPKPKKIRKRPIKYFCDLCDYGCRHPSEMVAHKLSRHGIETESVEAAKNCICGMCDYRTENSANMRRHMATHTGIKQFACDECDYKTAVKWSLENHKRVHSKVPLEKTHKCEHCSYAATNKWTLRGHLKNVHKLVNSRPGLNSLARSIKCDYCDKTFSHRGTYRMHRMSHENQPSVRKILTCNMCFKKVSGYGALGKHKAACVKDYERIVVDDTGGGSQEKYACRSCGENFSSHEEGMAHNCPHPSKFRCTICEFSCKQKPQLVNHMMIHTGEKPHECKVCHARFRQIPHLVVHMRTHTGEKPFACSYCGKAFAARQNMQSHEKIHTGETPYECTFCEYRAKERRNLRKHMQTHHYVEDSDLVMEDM